MKKASLVSTIVIGAIGILVGIMFAFLASFALAVICIICGVLTLLSGIPQLVGAVSGLIKKEKLAIVDLIMSIVTVAVGLMLIFSRNELIMIIVGAYLIVFPVIRILIAKEKMAQLKSELLAIILGVALVLIGPGAALGFIFKIAGAVVIVFSYRPCRRPWCLRIRHLSCRFRLCQRTLCHRWRCFRAPSLP